MAAGDTSELLTGDAYVETGALGSSQSSAVATNPWWLQRLGSPGFTRGHGGLGCRNTCDHGEKNRRNLVDSNLAIVIVDLAISRNQLTPKSIGHSKFDGSKAFLGLATPRRPLELEVAPVYLMVPPRVIFAKYL